MGGSETTIAEPIEYRPSSRLPAGIEHQVMPDAGDHDLGGS
jgi:hypothetical protein